MRSYICEAAPNLEASKLRKIETDALAIEQDFWFERGWVAGQDSLLQWLVDNNAITSNDMAQFRSAQSPSSTASTLDLLARIVQVNAKVAPHAKPKRGKGRPSKGASISSEDLSVLHDAINSMLADMKNRTATNQGRAIRIAVEQHYRAGKLSKNTTIAGHTKRITRWVTARDAEMDK